MKVLRHIVLLIIISVSSSVINPTYSTHVIGGEIFYECLDSNLSFYRFTVKLYRDCYTGVPPYDDPIYVSVYDSLENLLIQFEMELPPDDTLENNTYNICLYAPVDICVQEAVYTADYILPPGKYHMTYQRCCRNQGIINMFNPTGQGAGWDIAIPDPSQASCNSSPYYNNYPPTIICLDAPFEYDHSATDPDGDSLVYFFCTPSDYNNGTWGIIPNPSGPPSSNFDVNYVTPYSASYPIYAPTDPFQIDPQTGWLTGTPEQLGKYVVGICVSEYRDGVLLSTNKRDFQFNIAGCLDDPLLLFSSEPDPCNNLKINFTYEGNVVATYKWDFGVDSLLNDTSILENPTYTYPDLGSYPVTLIVNEDYYCADTLTIGIVPPLPLIADFSWEKVCVYEPVNFTDQSDTNAYTGPIVGWNWDFGDGNYDLINQNTTHTYSDDDPHFVTLIIETGNNCRDTIEQLITFYPLPNIDAGEDLYVTQGEEGQLEASGGFSYSWMPPTYLNNPNIYNPTVTPTYTTGYEVTGTSIYGCLGRDDIIVKVVDPKIDIPNAFSPNDDDENDVVYLLHVGVLELLEFKIFNRWGQLVFETSDLEEGWDGNFKGQPQEIGNFAYYYKATSLAGQTMEGAGDIALLR